MEEFGINFGESGAGRAISEGYKALSLVASGKGVFSQGLRNSRVTQPSRSFFTFTSLTPPVVFATSCSRILSMEQKGNQYTVGVICGGPTASEASNNSHFYVYAEADPNASLPEYGLVVNDSKGDIIYNSDMRMIKVAGFARKNTGEVNWFVDPSNKKIAWTMLGADLDIFINPTLSTLNVRGNLMAHIQGQREVKFTNAPFLVRPWNLGSSVGNEIGVTDSDIFALAIDVTDI